MNSFNINLQIEDFDICDYYDELMKVLEEITKEQYKKLENRYYPEKEI